MPLPIMVPTINEIPLNSRDVDDDDIDDDDDDDDDANAVLTYPTQSDRWESHCQAPCHSSQQVTVVLSHISFDITSFNLSNIKIIMRSILERKYIQAKNTR